MIDYFAVEFHGIPLNLKIDYDVEPAEKGDHDCPPSEGGILINKIWLDYEPALEIEDPSDELVSRLEEVIDDRLMAAMEP